MSSTMDSHARGIQGRANGTRSDPNHDNLLQMQEEEARILTLMDQLRDLGMEGIDTELPQVMVCGAQSSGKSSVMHALTRLPFPRSEETCTRFVTRVTVVQDKHDAVEIRIQPSADDGSEQGRRRAKRLQEFRPSPRGSRTLAEFLKTGFEEAGQAICEDMPQTAMITEDTLLITIKGPSLMSIQLLDLPGLMGNDRGGGDKLKVQKIVERHMAMENTMILAVVKSTEDQNTPGTEVLGWCRGKGVGDGSYENGFDPEGKRTVCVLTCPDLTEARQSWKSILTGHANDFGYNNEWHVVRNPGPRDDENDRDELERSFFATGDWGEVPEENRGVYSLHKRLRKWLFDRSKSQLPKLHGDLEEELRNVRSILKQEESLGDATLLEVFRERISLLRDRARDHARGNYEDDIAHKLPRGSAGHLRSRVVQENRKFRDNLLKYGHTWTSKVVLPPPDLDQDLHASAGRVEDTPQWRAKLEAWKKAQQRFEDVGREIEFWKVEMQERGGMEIEGEIGEQHIRFFFRKMTDQWHDIGLWHAEEVFKWCMRYFQEVTPRFLDTLGNQSLFPERGFHNAARIGQRLIEAYIEPQLETRREAALRALRDLELDRNGPLLEYELAFLAKRREYRNDQNFRSTMQGQNALKDQYINPSILAQASDAYTQESQWNGKTKDFLHAAWEHYSVSLDTNISLLN